MSTATIILICLVVAVVFLGGGCLTCFCIGAKSSSDTNDDEKRHARNVGIAQLLSEYRANEARADQNYKGKWITVQGGQVEDIRSGYLTVGTGKLLEIPVVQCQFNSDQAGRAAQLSKGRRVIVRGKVQGLLFNVMVRECEIL